MTTLLNINIPDKMNPSIKAMACQLQLIYLFSNFALGVQPTHYTKTYALQLYNESDIIYAKGHGVKKCLEVMFEGSHGMR